MDQAIRIDHLVGLGIYDLACRRLRQCQHSDSGGTRRQRVRGETTIKIEKRRSFLGHTGRKLHQTSKSRISVAPVSPSIIHRLAKKGTPENVVSLAATMSGKAGTSR